MDLASSEEPLAQCLEAVWGSKIAPKALPEQTKIFKWIIFLGAKWLWGKPEASSIQMVAFDVS